MLLQLIFRNLPTSLQVNLLKNSGTLVGSRLKANRYLYLYMFRDFFAEILFKNDNADEPVENLMIFSNIKTLNNHLESDLRSLMIKK